MSELVYRHVIGIDHWEKDKLGYTYMVDTLGRKWWKQGWMGSNHYQLERKRDNMGVKHEAARVMKQRDKFMEFFTYGEEEESDKYFISGSTVQKWIVLQEYLFDGTIFSGNSRDTILEYLLEE